jgi:hypothetical protein
MKGSKLLYRLKEVFGAQRRLLGKFVTNRTTNVDDTEVVDCDGDDDDDDLLTIIVMMVIKINFNYELVSENHKKFTETSIRHIFSPVSFLKAERNVRSLSRLFHSRTRQDTAPDTEMYRKQSTPHSHFQVLPASEPYHFPRYSSVSLKELTPIKDKFYNTMQHSDVLYFCTHLSTHPVCV